MNQRLSAFAVVAILGAALSVLSVRADDERTDTEDMLQETRAAATSDVRVEAALDEQAGFDAGTGAAAAAAQLDAQLRECLTDPPYLLNTSPECDEYPECLDYLGANARCFCRCSGNDLWSSFVRGCLRCLIEGGVDSDTAHPLCFLAATQRHPIPFGLLFCYLTCWLAQWAECGCER